MASTAVAMTSISRSTAHATRRSSSLMRCSSSCVGSESRSPVEGLICSLSGSALEAACSACVRALRAFARAMPAVWRERVPRPTALPKENEGDMLVALVRAFSGSQWECSLMQRREFDVGNLERRADVEESLIADDVVVEVRLFAEAGRAVDVIHDL